MSESNGSSVFVELLRGRDGLPGRDGPPGKDGEPGPAGPPGTDGTSGPSSGGALYTRWGKSSCPQGNGTELVYTGITGGTQYGLSGGGANHLCMPKDPEYSDTLRYRTSVDGYAVIYGSQYQGTPQKSHGRDVPCAVCYVSTRPTVVMIPAKHTCPPTWTMEYYGYLMTERKDSHRSIFECMDENLEPLPEADGSTGHGARFFHVETNCESGLPCLPYSASKELNCVVCSK